MPRNNPFGRLDWNRSGKFIAIYVAATLLAGIPVANASAALGATVAMLFGLVCVTICVSTKQIRWRWPMRIGYVLLTWLGISIGGIAAMAVIGYPFVALGIGRWIDLVGNMVAAVVFLLIAMTQSRVFVSPQSGKEDDERTRTKLNARRYVSVIAAICAVVVIGLAVGSRVNRQAETSAAEQSLAAAMGATNRFISEDDLETAATLRTFTTRWNTAAAPLMRGYLDPNVSAEQWVSDAGEHVEGLTAASMRFSATVQAFEDPGLRARYQVLAKNYDRKLAAIHALRHAVAQQDPDGETTAIIEVREAALEGRELAIELMDSMRPHVGPDQMRRLVVESADKTYPWP